MNSQPSPKASICLRFLERSLYTQHYVNWFRRSDTHTHTLAGTSTWLVGHRNLTLESQQQQVFKLILLFDTRFGKKLETLSTVIELLISLCRIMLTAAAEGSV